MAEGEQVTAISGATLEKAVSELHEDPSTRLQYIDDLRKLVENDEEAEDSVDHSVRRNDSKFLLRFLRAKKFDVDRARALYSNYYTFRAKHADILGTLEPRALDHVYRCGIVSLLEHRDKTGCAVMCFKPSLWPMDQYPLTDLVRGLLMLLERLMEDEENQVHGLRFVYNFDGVSLYQMFTVARSDLARNGIMVELFQVAAWAVFWCSYTLAYLGYAHVGDIDGVLKLTLDYSHPSNQDSTVCSVFKPGTIITKHNADVFLIQL